jgi:hypothetical protein
MNLFLAAYAADAVIAARKLFHRLSEKKTLQVAELFNISETFRIPENVFIFDLRNLT